MKSVLEQFYFRKFSPFERGYPDTPEIQKAQEDSRLAQKRLRDALPEEAKSLLFEDDKATSRLHLHTNADTFAYGFKLGALFMLEVLADQESLSGNDA